MNFKNHSLFLPKRYVERFRLTWLVGSTSQGVTLTLWVPPTSPLCSLSLSLCLPSLRGATSCTKSATYANASTTQPIVAATYPPNQTPPMPPSPPSSQNSTSMPLGFSSDLVMSSKLSTSAHYGTKTGSTTNVCARSDVESSSLTTSTFELQVCTTSSSKPTTDTGSFLD